MKDKFVAAVDCIFESFFSNPFNVSTACKDEMTQQLKTKNSDMSTLHVDAPTVHVASLMVLTWNYVIFHFHHQTSFWRYIVLNIKARLSGQK